MKPLKRILRLSAPGLSAVIVILGAGLLFLSLARSESGGPLEKNTSPGGLSEKFNHDTTSFPLLYAHRGLKCADCHLGGRYQNLPTSCEACHNGQIAYGKPPHHVRTIQNCDLCHGQSAWFPAAFRHDLAMVQGQCFNCHNGQTATGKPRSHVSTTAQCDVCHQPTGWTPASFAHDASTVGQCSNCHNGQTATGKPPAHILTTAQCDVCHQPTGWTPASFAHDASTVGQCSNCHNGQTAMGKPAGHIPTTSQCDTCHRTTGWLPASFAHDASTAGQCSNCHNGQTATGMPSTHAGMAFQCDTCHITSGWAPAAYSAHDNPKLIGAHTPLDCAACHPKSFSSVFFRDGTQYGFCANCHTRDYVPKPEHHTSIAVDAMCANCHRHADYKEF